MKVSEAKQISREWLMNYLCDLPRFVGAIFAGSIHEKEDNHDWKEGSDVDLFIYQSGKPSERLSKFQHRGLTIEAALHSADELVDIEKVLSHPHVAPHFANCEILLDPDGKMKQIHYAVKEMFAQPQYIRGRMDWVHNNAQRKLQQTIDAKGDQLIGPLCVFLLGLRNIAALAPVATLSNPTMRRCLVVQREVLHQQGASELHQSMLKILGSDQLSQKQVEEMIPPMLELYLVAAEVVKTPFWARFELDPGSTHLFEHGVREMIEAGDHREAVFFILFVHYFSHHAISVDGSESQKQFNLEVLHHALAKVGIASMDEMKDRSLAGLELLPRVRAICDRIIQ